MVCARICLLHIPCRIFWCKALCDTPLTYLLLARLGLHGCAWGICGRGMRGPLVGARGLSTVAASHCRRGSRAQAQYWRHTARPPRGARGLPGLGMGPVSCIGRWTAVHWATRKSSLSFQYLKIYSNGSSLILDTIFFFISSAKGFVHFIYLLKVQAFAFTDCLMLTPGPT